MAKQERHSENELFYNVKVLRVWVSYFRETLNWKDDKIEEIFAYCKSDPSFLDSEDNWFGQEFADRFNYKAVELSDDPDISRKVGAFSTKESARGLTGSLFTSLLSTSLVYRNMKRLGSYYSKGATLIPAFVGRGKAVIHAEITPGCEEKPYQCQNRIGMISAIPDLFGVTDISVEHRVCFHEGGPRCEYEISWIEPWRARPGLIALLSVFAAILLSKLFLGWKTSIAIATATGVLATAVWREVRNHRILQALRGQTNELEQATQILEKRNEESVLLRQIMKSTSAMMPIESLCKTIVDSIHEVMDYDRAIILLVDKEKQTLKTQAISGYLGKAQEMLEKAEFRIDPENVTGHLIRVVNTKEPLLARNVLEKLDQLSPRSQQLVKALHTDSFIAAPILFKQDVLGVIGVENTRSSNPLSHRDLQLVSSLADNVAVAISNARSYEALNETLKMTDSLRALFQKYVPSEMRVDKLHEAEGLALKKKVLSVMFIDIMGFTQLSEKQDPETIAQVLNIFIEEIHNQVDKHGGRINKIMGDGMLIYFDPAEHNAIDAGISILNCMNMINYKLHEQKLPGIAIGVGAHKGECTLGNIGSSKRLDYTLIGDTVNIASRIEGVTRKFGPNSFCFSDSLLEEAKHIKYSTTEKISLKGQSKPININLFVPENFHLKKVA